MLTVTKLWTEGTRPQKDAWHEYALASFLMGSSGTSDAFSFIYDKTPRFHPWSATVLGTPLGKYFKTSERALQAPSLIGAGDGEPDR